MKSSVALIAVLCCGGPWIATSQAQYPGNQFGRGPSPFSRPTVSPYLNLLQNGNPAINYYGLVRPQMAYDRALQNIGNNLNALGNNVTSLDANQTPQTGHRASFQTQGQYFMTNGAVGPGAYGNQQGNRPGGGQATGGRGLGQSGAQRSPSAPSAR